MVKPAKYAYVNMGEKSIRVRIKTDTPIDEGDKNKLTAWAQDKGFMVSARRRVLRAE